MDTGLGGKTVLVTGGAAGLGRAIALAFAAEGANIALLDINDDGLASTADEVRALGVACETYHVDVSDEAAIIAFGDAFCAAHETLDVLVNNAGLAYGEISFSFLELSMEKWLRYLAINTVSPLIMAKAVRPALAKAKGLVINQSSMAANVPASCYGVTKAALNSMTYGIANQFAGDGIRCNSVEPGIMETPANMSSISPETYNRVQGMQLLDAHGVAEDIANLHVFLASRQGRFINNEVILCDGGNRMRGWRY